MGHPGLEVVVSDCFVVFYDTRSESSGIFGDHVALNKSNKLNQFKVLCHFRDKDGDRDPRR